MLSCHVSVLSLSMSNSIYAIWHTNCFHHTSHSVPEVGWSLQWGWVYRHELPLWFLHHHQPTWKRMELALPPSCLLSALCRGYDVSSRYQSRCQIVLAIWNWNSNRDVHHCIFFLYLLRILSLYHGKPIMDLIASPCVGSMLSLIPALWSSCCFCSALIALTSSSKRMPESSELPLKMLRVLWSSSTRRLRVRLLSFVMGAFGTVTRANVNGCKCKLNNNNQYWLSLTVTPVRMRMQFSFEASSILCTMVCTSCISSLLTSSVQVCVS